MSDSLQNKLSRFETAPPVGVWDKIEETLDAQQDYRQRLHRYEEQPPNDFWKNIEASLDEKEARVIPLSTRFRKPIRYVAAASIIAIILTTTTLLRKKVTADTLPVQSAAVLPSIKKTTFVVDSSSNTLHKGLAQSQLNQTAVDKKTVATNKKSGNGIKRKIFTSTGSNNFLFPEKIGSKKFFSYASTDEVRLYKNANGNTLKLSEKTFDLINCTPADEACKERLRQLRQKLSTSAMTADFAGLLDMIRQLQ